MAKYFPGTNIPISSFKGSNNKKEELIERLEQDMAAGDIDGMNDAIFSVAYYSKGGQGQGQGNANVSKVHNGTWEVTADVGDNKSWAESSINSANDVYIQKDGSVISWDDNHGVAKDGDSKGHWGGQDKTEQGFGATKRGVPHPDKGIKVGAPISPVISGGGGNSSANFSVLDNIWKGEFADLAAAGIGDYGKTKAGTSTASKSGWNVGGPGGPAGETSLLAYRPGSEAYWKSYMGPKMTGSLMRMKQPAATQASLGYLPGEIRDPTNWANFQGYDGPLSRQFQGVIPMGTWRRSLSQYPGLGDAGVRQPGWQFAAAPSGMINQPAWAAYDITPQAAGEWTGLLGDWAAPKLNTTNLLGAA